MVGLFLKKFGKLNKIYKIVKNVLIPLYLGQNDKDKIYPLHPG